VLFIIIYDIKVPSEVRASHGEEWSGWRSLMD
jgi:hypothetical protein